MTEIINKPIFNDIWPIIFKELSIKDLFNCRLVNKLFKHFSDHTNGINRLIIGQPDYYEYEFSYYLYYNEIDEYNYCTISLKCFRTIKELSIFNLDKYLKYLRIYDEEFKLKEISNFINLEEIDIGVCINDYNQEILNLKNLKYFSSIDCSVQLNTPKLETILSIYINQIKLKSNLESIKHLITRNYDNKFEIFKNLEILELFEADRYIINENLLILFKKLKQLRISLWFDVVNYSNETIKNKLIKILNDKIELERVFDIYLEDTKIVNIDKFNELVSNKDSLWKFKLNNYDLSDLDPRFIHKLEYDQLERCVNNIKNDLPSSFFDVYIYICKVKVSSINDIDGLNWFLTKLKYLTNLQICHNVSLSEIFYNNLPNKIIGLEIYNKDDINYDFILKLSKLNHFYTSVDKDLFDLAFKSFLNLKDFKYFEFYYRNKRIKIEKNDKYFHLNNKKKQLNYNQLIKKCNKLRLKRLFFHYFFDSN